MSFTEDWDAFFNTDEFADVVTLVSQGTTVHGIFVNPMEQGELTVTRQQSFAPLKTFLEEPHLILPEQTVTTHNIAKGNAITVNNENFVVCAKPFKDGTGMAILRLKAPEANSNEKAWQA